MELRRRLLLVYRSGFTAGYDPMLDATAVAFGDDLHSTIMVMPGQQGSSVPGDNLERLGKSKKITALTMSSLNRSV